MDATSTQIIGIFGIVVASFIAGRFSNQINCCRRNVIKTTTKSKSGDSKGIYSTKFYNKNKIEHTKLVSITFIMQI